MPSRARRLGFAAVLAAALAAVALGGSGVATLVLERRLQAVAPGGLDIARLHYNPLTGRLQLAGVRARDAEGREVFRADAVSAVTDPLGVLTGRASFRTVTVTSPHVVLPERLDLGDVTTAWSPAVPAAPPVSVEGLLVTGGSIVLEGAGEHGTALVVRDVGVRLSRLAAAPLAGQDPAFAVDMALHGSVVRLTGQPVRAGGDLTGYAFRLRARDIDVAALLRSFPIVSGVRLDQGRGDLEGEVLVSGGRLLLSGHARLADVRGRLPGVPGPVRAATLGLAVDRVDLAAGTGRISRIELGAPTLTLSAAAATALGGTLQRLLTGEDLVVRRIRVTDGALTVRLDNRAAIAVTALQLSAAAGERGGEGYAVAAQGRLGGQGRLVMEGVTGRDLAHFDGAVRLEGIDLGTWVALAAPGAAARGRLSFDGRARVEQAGAGARASLSGQVVLTDAALGGLGAERIAVRLRRLDWPGGAVLLDTVALMRPALAVPALGAPPPWPAALVAGRLTVTDGRLERPGGGLGQVEVELLPDGPRGEARLMLSAARDEGGRVVFERSFPWVAEDGGVRLRALLGALADASRAAAVAAPPTSSVLEP